MNRSVQPKTILYNHIVAGRQKRPNAQMPINAHQAVAKLLKSILAVTERHPTVRDNLNFVRGELDEWVMREYTVEELDQETFLNLYYGTDRATPGTPVAISDLLLGFLQIEQILSTYYPDCGPVRELGAKLRQAMRTIRSWSN